jgi:predicted ATPase/DNA-binding CsgD family transcriptional regulator
MTELVGREVEKTTLLGLLDRAAAGGTVVLLIEGPAGVGKTALVEDFGGALPDGVLYAGGVYDEAAQHIPYSGLRQALNGLLRAILAQNSQEVAAWRLRLQKALGPHGPIIADFAPELERLLGPQPLPSELAPEEQRERLHDAAEALMAGLAGAGMPLVLFLDNLQWAGQLTFDLLPHLGALRPGQMLLVIGAVRGGANAALGEALDRISDVGAEFHRLALAPLPVDSVAALAAERLDDDPAHTQALAGWLHRQTGGNPLHVAELLSALIRQGALTPPGDGPGASWRWDPAGAALSDDLAALLAQHLHGLTFPLQAALATGAHLGASFALDDLAEVREAEPAAMAALLAPAVEDGILMAADAGGRPIAAVDASLPVTYRFRHDRIAEAAAALTPETDRAALHLRIGRALLPEVLEGRGGAPEGGRVLEAAAHLNAGSELMVDPAERVQLAALNLAAGRIRRSVAAFADAWWSFACGLGLLPSDGWQTHYDLARDLHVEAAGIAPLVGEAVAPLAEPVLVHARTSLDTVEAHRSLILAAAAEGQFDEALRLGNRALAALGEKPLPLNPSRPDVLAEFLKTRASLRGKSMADLRNAPRMTDPRAIGVDRILLAMLEALQIRSRQLPVAVAALRIVRRTQIFGRSPLASFGYIAYATLLTRGLGSIEAAIACGQLALELAEADGSPWLQNRVRLAWLAGLSHRVQPLEETLEPLYQVSRRALALGDVTMGVIAALIYAQHTTIALRDYDALFDAVFRLGENITWQGFDALRLDYMMELQYLQNLRRPSPNPVQLTGDYWDESSIQERLEGHDNTAFLGSYHTLKAALAYFFHDYARALEHADAGRDRLDQFAGLYAYPAALTVDSLVRLAASSTVSGGRRRQLLRQTAANQRNLVKLVRQMPANLEHFHLFVEAEQARTLGHTEQAKALFEQTIAICQARRFPVEEASSSEAFGRMLLHLGETGEARCKLSRSRDVFRRLGALAKVAQMERVYAQWLDPAPAAAPPPAASLAVPMRAKRDEPGPAVLLQMASEAIAHATAPAELLSRLMAAVVAQTGATRVVLLSRPSGAAGFVFEAECAGDGSCAPLDALPLAGGESDLRPAPVRVLNFTANTAEPLLVTDAAGEEPFAGDPTIRARGVRAVLCLPLRRQQVVIGLLYLENGEQPGAFREEDVPLLTLVATQVLLALENARLIEGGKALSPATADGAPSGDPGDPPDQLRRLMVAGDWVAAAAGFDAALARAAGASDPKRWRELCLDLPPELSVLPGGQERLAAARRADDALAPPDDVAWQRARIRRRALDAWLRGRLAEVVAIGHSEEGGPGRAEARLFDPPCLSAAAHTVLREYDAARGCLDLALAHLPAGGLGRDVWFGLAVRRARLYWLLGALPRLEALLREIEADPEHRSPLASALLPALRGVLALEQADLPSAEGRLAEAISLAGEQPATRLLIRPELHLARVYELTGRSEQAGALVDAALAEVRLTGAPGLILLEGTAVIPMLRAAAQRGREGPAAARVLRLMGVANVSRRLLIPETGQILSPREADVLELLAADAPNRAIADRLGVDIITVKSHVTRVLAKLGVRSRYEAAERAKALGLDPATDL